MNFRNKRTKFTMLALCLVIITGVIMFFTMNNYNKNTNGSNNNSPAIRAERPVLDGVETAMKKGVNLEGLEGGTSSTFHMDNNSLYEDIASKGFDHIRLPVDFRRYSDENGIVSDEFYTRLDKIISMANENGLAVALDFHAWWDFNMSRGDDELFLSIWENVATHYRDYDTTMLAFELINEPHTTEGGDLDMDNLNILQRNAVELIRSITPKRTIVLATAEWNESRTLKDFTLTEYDNVYVAVHTYAPLDFTHQGMRWAGTQDVHIALDEWKNDEFYSAIAALRNDLFNIKAFKKQTGMNVVLNEFGLNTTGHIDDADVEKYLSVIMEFTEENDIPWTYWSFTGDFGLYDRGLFGIGKGWREIPLGVLTNY